MNTGVGSHLAWQVEEQVVAFQRAQLVLQPVDVLAQVVDVVDERTVGSQLELVHHLLQLHQLRHVHGNLYGGDVLAGSRFTTATGRPVRREEEAAHEQRGGR